MNIFETTKFDAGTKEGNSNIQSQNLKVIRAIDSFRKFAEKSFDEGNIDIQEQVAELRGKGNDSFNSDYNQVYNGHRERIEK